MDKKDQNNKKKNKNNKILQMRIPEKMANDPEMDEFIKQKMMEDADRYERELNSNKKLDDVKAPDDMFEKILKELDDKGIRESDENKGVIDTQEGKNIGYESKETKNIDYEEEIRNKVREEMERFRVEERERIHEEERKKIENSLLSRKLFNKIKRLSKFQKVAILAVIIVVAILGTSTTGVANRLLVQISYIFDEDNKIKVEYSNGVYQNNDSTEKQALDAIYEETGISGLIFDYRPEEFEYEEFDIVEPLNMATMTYSYNEYFVYLTMQSFEPDIGMDVGLNVEYADPFIERVKNVYSDISIDIMKLESEEEIEGDDSQTMVAMFVQKNVEYTFSGNIPNDEFMKMIEQFRFYK